MCLDCLSSVKIFSTIDLQSAYMLLEVAEDDGHKIDFITKYGLFEYLAMPFGLCNAPSTFQRCMEMVFRGISFWFFWMILLSWHQTLKNILNDLRRYLDAYQMLD